MCSKGEGSDHCCGWVRSEGSRNRGRFQGIRKGLWQLKKDGSSVNGKGFVLNALKCSGIWCVSVSKVELLEGSMDRKHLVITCTSKVIDEEIPRHAPIDCGATGIAFPD